MSITGQDTSPARGVDRSQYGLAALLAVVGGFLIVDALSIGGGYAKVDPLGPKVFPIVVGSGLFVVAVVFAVAVARGSHGHAEEGEDIDLSTPADWRTVGLLVAVFVATIVAVNPLGWPIAGALLFGGAATVLGNRHWVRNIAIGLILGLLTFYGFYSGLGIPLPAGILDGIL